MGEQGECTKTTHMDMAGKEPIKRFRVEDSIGVYVIVCPVSSASVAQTSCFSQPTFLVSQFPSHLRSLRRHELLLTFRFRPLVWKLLLEEYPGLTGVMTMMGEATSQKVEPTAKEEVQSPIVMPSKRSPARNARDPLGDDAAAAATATPRREHVGRPDGLASVFKEHAAARSMGRSRDPPPSVPRSSFHRPAATMPSRKLGFTWEEASDDSASLDGSSKREPPSSRDSLSNTSPRSSAGLEEAFRAIASLQRQLVRLKEDNAQREESLGGVIKGLQSDIRQLQADRASNQLREELRGYSLSTQPYVLPPAEKVSIVTEI